MPRTEKRLPGLVLAGLLALGAGGCGGPEVEVVPVTRRPIREGFTEPARTRLTRTYPVTMPFAGRVAPLKLREGDPVRVGQPLARADTVALDQEIRALEAQRARFRAELARVDDDRLEATTRRGLVQELAASREMLRASRAQLEAEDLRKRQLEADLVRDEKLVTQKAITRERLDRTRLDAHTARIDWRQQEFTLAALEALHTALELGPGMVDDWMGREDHDRAVLAQQIAEVEAHLVDARHRRSLLDFPSPVDGVVLERSHPGGATLAAGTELLVLGSLEDLEVVAEVLTRDAQHLEPGTPVTLEGSLPARVAALEPQGFTKLSSLGVEQQRVMVRIAPEAPLERVGPGYRLEAHFTTASREEALVVPRQVVLQDSRRRSYVLRYRGGKLEKVPVETGLGSDLELEVREGLEPGDRVVLYPEVGMGDGQAVTVAAPGS